MMYRIALLVYCLNACGIKLDYTNYTQSISNTQHTHLETVRNIKIPCEICGEAIQLDKLQLRITIYLQLTPVRGVQDYTVGCQAGAQAGKSTAVGHL